MRPIAFAFLPLAAALACGGSNTSSGFYDAGPGSLTGSSSGGSGGGSGGGGSGSFGDGGSGSGSGSGGGNGCTGQAADYVYVLSAEDDLYSFAPNLKQFTKVGRLGCKTSMKPNSMAVDRNANAYVNYVQSGALGDTGGALFQVSTKDASCAATAAVNLPKGWYRVGMGYSTNSNSATTETLYVDGVGGGPGKGNATGLGLVDFGKGTVGPIGPFTGMVASQPAELTGTGDGRLFGFFTTKPVYVAQVDKTSGATPTAVPMTGLQVPLDWAFSFWGGHFYLYTSQNTSAGSNVTDYDPTSGTVNTTYMTSVGFNIVGAGVSTCAPVTMPVQ